MIEALIAFGLIGLLFSLLFSHFRTALGLAAKVHKAKVIVEERQYFMERMTSVWEKVVISSIEKEEKKVNGEIHTVLHFFYENGLDPELTFSGHRKGEILVDPAGQIVLTTHSKDEKLSRKEILLSGIKDYSWDLTTPTVIKLHLQDKNDKEFDFAFILPRDTEDRFKL